MSVYVVTLKATYLSKNIFNVFTYRTVTPASQQGSALDLATVFDDVMVDAITPTVHASTNFFEVDVFDLFFPANIGTLAINKNGTRAGEAMPRANSWSMRTNRATRAIRRGQKRFGGVSESDQSNNLWNAGYITVLQTAVNLMDDVLLGPAAPGVSYFPIVVKRLKVVVGGKTQYVFPDDPADLQFFDILDWQFNTEVTTQNSRKLKTFIAP